MTQIYEGMFLLDNQVVREDWKKAKGVVTDTLAKHGATVHTARRWDERKLAYPIDRNNRATFLLAYYEIPGENIPAMVRDFNLSESVLRYLSTSVDAIPEEEAGLAEAENAADFSVPPPPADDAPDPDELTLGEPEEDDRPRGRRAPEGDKPEQPEKPEKAEAEAAPAASETSEEAAEAPKED